MAHHLLIGAGFSRNWGGPLSEEITGSLLGEVSRYPNLVSALRSGPFEDAFRGFQSDSNASDESRILQSAVTALFDRLNKSFLVKQFEFNNDIEYSIKRFLAKFDAIFSLNQDMLLEIHYIQTFISQGKWSGVTMPGMVWVPPADHRGPIDLTTCKWRPTRDIIGGPQFQPFYKLHGSSNWFSESGDPLLVMGNAKTGAIERNAVLRGYHEQFAAKLNEGNAKLLVIGYSFQDEHINALIDRASRRHGLGVYLVDPRGRDVLIDQKMTRAAIRPKRDIEDVKLIGELRRPLSSVFAGDAFAHGELMRFFL